MGERHHLPVGLVHAVERSLTPGLSSILCHLFRQVSHLVGSHDSPTHIQRLRQQNGARPDVACVGAQSVHQLLSLVVQCSRHLVQVCAQLLLQGRGQHLRVTGDAALQLSRQSRPQVPQSRLLRIAQQGNLAARMLVATHRTDMWQIFRPCRPAHIGRHVAPHLCHAHLLIVAQCHRPATVKAQHRLTIADHAQRLHEQQ